YVVAVAVGDVGEAGDAAIEDCLYWDLEDPYHYVRRDGGLVLIGGEDHRAGMDGGVSAGERYGALEKWGARVLGVRGTRVKAWSGQVNEPADGVAFIGRVPGKGYEACYAITGDSGMGLTHGTLGAMLVTDLIQGRRSAWSEVYGPDRKPVHGLGEYAKENIVSAAQFKDYVLPGDVASAEEIAAGCGAVLREGLKLIAASRDEEGRLVQRSAVCPHLKCVVRWNATAREWNCPCHGSRFDPWGRVLTGPAVRDLADAGEAAPEVRPEAP
ncbi:MAG TPA: FAD-dependent oxidoreductase, partial [Phycisphaerales bacterium]|nr:FAD-dependent oxidoreductase [Phycisphaerales bacterium]